MLLAQQLLLLAVDVSPNCSEVPEDSEEIYTEYFNYFYHITTVKDFLISLFGLSEHDLKSYGISQECVKWFNECFSLHAGSVWCIKQ